MMITTESQGEIMKKKETETVKVVLIAAMVLVAAVILMGIGGQAQQANGNRPAQDVQRVPVSVTVNQVNGAGGNAGPANTGATGDVGTANTNVQTSQGSSCQTNSVYFIHADWCPHCQKMAPWVADLEAQGYKFVGVTSDNLASYRDCLKGVAQMQYIPEFVCLSTSQSHVGEFNDKSELKAFADDCGANPQ
jgi:thiol-disulfide isomerase/thioredoxin